jgi:DNA primase
MRIPDAKIDEVRSSSNIVDVISSYVRLKKRGKSYIGLCPFHQEKTPSFTVSPERQMYHCFGCGVGGNVFTFLMEIEKVSFVEAVRTLAERMGILLPEEGGEDRAQATENEGLYNACRLAGLHFHENLSTVEGKLALEYFRHRGFADETIRRFGLGYAMNAWDDLIRFGESKGIGIDVLEKAGLAIRREDGSGGYDRFRGRAIFPIFSPSGRSIAFGARKMREDDPVQGKYINSPETPVYVKSRTLYGLFHAREAIREAEFAILVEGYADLVSVFQAGIANVVASSGTALTEEQIQLVARYAPTITLVYDADSAGSKAALRGVDLILENGLDVRVAALPDGEDPDSFVRKFGGKEFRKLVDGAESFLDFMAKTFQTEGLLATPEGQTRAVRSIVGSIARMKDELRRNVYIRNVSEKFGIYESVLFRELEKTLGQERSRPAAERRGGGTDSVPLRGQGTPVSVLPAEFPAVQRDLLKLMLEHGPEMIRFVFAHATPDLFTAPGARQIVDLLRSHADQVAAWDVSTLLDQIGDDALRRSIADIVFARYELSRGWEARGDATEEPDPWKVAERCLVVFRRNEIDDQIAENQKRMKEAAARGEPGKPYLEHHQALLAEKKELESRRIADAPDPESAP